MNGSRGRFGGGCGRAWHVLAVALVLSWVFGGVGMLGFGTGCEGRDEGRPKRRRSSRSRRGRRHVRRGSRRHGRRWGRRRGHGRWRRVRKAKVLVKPGSMGRMVAAVDGDTFWIKLDGPDNRLIKARLDGANAPECEKERARLPNGRATAHCVTDEEFFGLESYRMVKKLAEGHRVRISCRTGRNGFCKTGSFGRPLLSLLVMPKRGLRRGRVRGLQKPVDLGEWLVEKGGAWPFTKYWSPLLAKYCKAEQRAWRSKAGMWRAGSRAAVMAKMSKKTQKWYARRDEICRRAVRGEGPVRRRRVRKVPRTLAK